MCGGDGPYLRFVQMGEYRYGKCGAFCRVGAGAQFVKQDKRVLIRIVDYFDLILHV